MTISVTRERISRGSVTIDRSSASVSRPEKHEAISPDCGRVRPSPQGRVSFQTRTKVSGREAGRDNIRVGPSHSGLALLQVIASFIRESVNRPSPNVSSDRRRRTPGFADVNDRVPPAEYTKETGTDSNILSGGTCFSPSWTGTTYGRNRELAPLCLNGHFVMQSA